MNLATFMIGATLATAPNTFAVPVFYTDRTTFEAAIVAAPGFAKVESFDNTPPAVPGVTQIFFPVGQTPEIAFSVANNQAGQTDPGLLNSSNADSLGLSSAITAGSGALTYKSLGSQSGDFFTIDPNTPVVAFGLDVTTSAATPTGSSMVTALGGAGVGSLMLDTGANSPQFVGVVDPAGISQVSFLLLGTLNVAFDSLSYRIVPGGTGPPPGCCLGPPPVPPPVPPPGPPPTPPVTTTLATATTTTQTVGTSSSTSTSEYICCMMFAVDFNSSFCVSLTTTARQFVYVQPQELQPPRLPH